MATAPNTQETDVNRGESPLRATKERVISGAQPSAASMHLGNYIGAIRNWARMQEGYDAFFFIPDLHAITVEQDPAALRHQTRLTAAQYIAAGLDPDRCVLFVQSHVPEHAQLAWVLNCITGFGEASRMTQFKDKSAKGGADTSSVGLFTYPILMAADILLYQARYVPVGEDQRQHLELTRDLAQRFNARFGETFTVPQPFIVKESAKIQDLQNPGAKMSKSAPSPAGLVNIMDTDKATAKKIKSAVTDDGTEVRFDAQAKPGVSNLLTIFSALTGRDIPDLEAEFEGRMYGHLKVALAEVVTSTLGPIRDRALELMESPDELDRILAVGAGKARAAAAETLRNVNDAVGFVPPLVLAETGAGAGR